LNSLLLVVLVILGFVGLVVVGSFIWFVRAKRKLCQVVLKHERLKLERLHGRVWTFREAMRVFKFREVITADEFAKLQGGAINWGVGMVYVKRRSDGFEGTIMFQDDPRFYYTFSGDPPHPFPDDRPLWVGDEE
jgi:hypothetical protein